jgi:hypothetical protein
MKKRASYRKRIGLDVLPVDKKMYVDHQKDYKKGWHVAAIFFYFLIYIYLCINLVHIAGWRLNGQNPLNI